MNASNSNALLKQYYIEVAQNINEYSNSRCDILEKVLGLIDQKISVLEGDRKAIDKLNEELKIIQKKNREIIESQSDEKIVSLNEKRALLNDEVRRELEALESVESELINTDEEILKFEQNAKKDEVYYDRIFKDIVDTCELYCHVLEIGLSLFDDYQRIAITFDDISTPNSVSFKRIGNRVHAEGTPEPMSADLSNGDELRTFILGIRRLFA